MRRLQRDALPDLAQAWLDERAARVERAEDPEAEAARLWEGRRGERFKQIQRVLLAMSLTGHCMYCEHNAGTDVEHFWPRSASAQGTFAWRNYLWVCNVCNQQRKKEQFPLDREGAPLLLDPTADEPLDHLDLDLRSGRFVGKTAKGETVLQRELLDLNAGMLSNGRRVAARTVRNAIVDFAAHCDAESPALALDQQRTVSKDFAHAGVLGFLLAVSREPGAAEVLDPDCLDALARYPEVFGWV